MIKILFLINSLGGGGAERVLVNLVNHMDKSKFDITVETMFSDGVNKDMLSPEIKYICRRAPEFNGVSRAFRLLSSRFLYKYFIGNAKYDIVVAYMHGAPTKIVAGCPDEKVKKISWLHNGDMKLGTFFKFWFRESDAINAYKRMDAVAGVSKSVAEAFEQYTNIKTTAVYNTNDTKRILEMSKQIPAYKASKNKITFCTAGRIESAKGYDRLVNSCAKLKEEGLDFELLIMGSGKDDEKVKEQVKQLGLEDTVNFLGFCDNPYSIMANSDAYILSSRTEGLPTVVTEALTVGLPVVATDVSGVREVLGENNEFGLIVENSEDGIYKGLKEFLTNENLMKKYRVTAKERSQRFDTEHTVKQAEEFFEKVMRK